MPATRRMAARTRGTTSPSGSSFGRSGSASSVVCPCAQLLRLGRPEPLIELSNFVQLLRIPWIQRSKSRRQYVVVPTALSPHAATAQTLLWVDPNQEPERLEPELLLLRGKDCIHPAVLAATGARDIRSKGRSHSEALLVDVSGPSRARADAAITGPEPLCVTACGQPPHLLRGGCRVIGGNARVPPCRHCPQVLLLVKDAKGENIQDILPWHRRGLFVVPSNDAIPLDN
jgi:hypothetical protein